MSDDKNSKGPQDSSRVNVNEDYELRYWSNKFKVSGDELRAIVAKVGVAASAVEDYVNGKR